MRRSAREAVVGAAAALLVFGAVPGVLVGLVGLPVPHRWTAHAVVSWHGLFDLLAVASWCAWAGCAWPILRSVASRVRSGDVAPTARFSDRIAVRITLGVLVLASCFGLGASVAGASVAGASVAGASVAGASVGGASAAARATAAAPPTSPPAPSSRGAATPGTEQVEAVGIRGSTKTASWVMRPGDTLASLAATHYGAVSDWPAIAAANLGRLMDDGTRFVDPAVIAPGWTLVLPALDADTRSDTGLERAAGAGPAPGTPVDGSATAALLPSGGSVLPLAELAASGISALVAGLLARRARQLRRLRAFLREEGEESALPDAREADLGALLAPFEQVPLVDMVEVAARDLGDVLATLAPTPGAVLWLRAGRDGVEVRFSTPVPERVRGWRRTGHATWLLPATVDLAERAHASPRAEPWCALLLPIGDDDRGTWLLPVGAGSRVAVVGPRAADLVRTMRAAVTTWSWHEEVVVTEDVDEVTDALGRAARSSTGVRAVGPQVLFVGDPKALSARARGACAVLSAGVTDAETVVFVDDRAASAHPLGLTVRPPLLDASLKGAVDALTGPSNGDLAADRRDGQHGRGEPPSGGPAPASPARSLVHRGTALATVRVADDGPGTGTTTHLSPTSSSGTARGGASTAASRGSASEVQSRGRAEVQSRGRAEVQSRGRAEVQSRGRAEVRLLATVPGIVGLQGELPAKRARRALELIAYLAVQTPDPVTGDRLRTRVLGSADADAAAKTLFNTVGAARRALGVAPDGEPLLPPASRSGHYRLSPLVTVDALRACALVHEGLACRDATGSVARLREALELVKGEPLGGVLTGYAWWRAEGHERRVADAVVDGACALVGAALDSGDVDLARWALVQARKVEPYSESLARAAMRVAAAGGDVRRLHAEWLECQRKMDELDPGGVPSERTERLYATLRTQLAGSSNGTSTSTSSGTSSGTGTGSGSGTGKESPGQASFAAIEAAPLRSVPSAPSTV